MSTTALERAVGEHVRALEARTRWDAIVAREAASRPCAPATVDPRELAEAIYATAPEMRFSEAASIALAITRAYHLTRRLADAYAPTTPARPHALDVTA